MDSRFRFWLHPSHIWPVMSLTYAVCFIGLNQCFLYFTIHRHDIFFGTAISRPEFENHWQDLFARSGTWLFQFVTCECGRYRPFIESNFQVQSSFFKHKFCILSEALQVNPKKLKIRVKYGDCINPSSYYAKHGDYNSYYNLTATLRFEELHDMIYIEDSEEMIGKTLGLVTSSTKFHVEKCS